MTKILNFKLLHRSSLAHQNATSFYATCTLLPPPSPTIFWFLGFHCMEYHCQRGWNLTNPSSVHLINPDCGQSAYLSIRTESVFKWTKSSAFRYRSPCCSHVCAALVPKKVRSADACAAARCELRWFQKMCVALPMLMSVQKVRKFQKRCVALPMPMSV